MKDLLSKIAKSLIIPLAALGISGCAELPMRSLDKSADKSYENMAGAYAPAFANFSNAEFALILADDVLHGFPLVKKINYDNEGFTQSCDYNLTQLWGPEQRAKFPDWKDDYKALAREADQFYGNNNGRVSYDEACETLVQVLKQVYNLKLKSHTKQ